MLARETGDRNSFWHSWYFAAKRGDWMNWEMQRDIALISDEVWKQGHKAVGEEIAKIEARYAKAKAQQIEQLDAIIAENPYAWRIKFDVSTQVFSASAIQPRDLSAIVDGVRDSIRRLHGRCKKMGIGNFGQSVQLAFDPVIAQLRADLKRYGQSPLSLLVAIEGARHEMEDIARKEHYVSESFITRFFLELQSAGEDICVAAPEVVEQLKKKQAVRFELYSMERKRLMMQQTSALHLSAEGILQRASLEALRVIQDDDASSEDRRTAFYFATAVLPRAAKAYIEATLDPDDGARSPAKRSVGKRIVDAADALAKLDKGKDAIVENAPIAADLVQSILSHLPPIG